MQTAITFEDSKSWNAKRTPAENEGCSN